MRVLIASNRFPSPPNRGDTIRTYNFAKQLKAKGAQVALVSFADVDAAPSEDARQDLHRWCDVVELVPHRRAALAKAVAAAPFSRVPAQILYYRSPDMAERLYTVMKSWCPDVVVLRSLRFAQYADVFDSPKAKVVLDACDCLSLLYRRALRHESNPAKRLAIVAELRRVMRYEASVYGRFSLVLACSAVDAKEMAALAPSGRYSVIGQGVDLDRFPSQPFEDGRLTCTFVGTMNSSRNRDAVVYFARAIWPKVRQRFPEANFLIVGSNPPPAITALGRDSSVIVTGSVADVTPYLRRTTVAVAPLRVGAGVKFKVLEAMASCRAVVTTPVGQEGIDAEPGVHLEVADSPDDFAERVLGLAESPARRRAMALRGRELVRRDHDWSTIVERLMDQVGTLSAVSD